MPIIFKKFFNVLKEKEITTYRIRKDKILSEAILQKLRNGGRIDTVTIERICKSLDCQPGDIMEYVKEE